MAMTRFRRRFRRRFRSSGHSTVEVSQFCATTVITVPNGSTAANPTITTTPLFAPSFAFAGVGTGGAPSGLKAIQILGLRGYTDYAPQVGVASVSAQSQVAEGIWHDSSQLGASAILPNYFLNEFNIASPGNESLLPKRTIFRRWTFMQIGVGNITIPVAQPGIFQASSSNNWGVIRTKGVRLDADRDQLAHTSCITNSTAAAIQFVQDIHFIVRYRYIW